VERVLITGGAGFIGSNLAERVLADGGEVVLLDNFDPFYDVRTKRRNLESIRAMGGSRLRFVEGDIRDRAAVRDALAGCAVVVHLAALAGVRPSIQEPARYMDVNVTGTQILLDEIRSKEVRFVFGSSSSVYGGRTTMPFRETDSVDAPVSPYAASKRAGELICRTWHHLRGNPVTSLRFFTVYGPRQRPEMAIHRFVRDIENGNALPFFGDGSTRRDYTFVDDIVTGVVGAMRRDHGCEIVNLGGAAVTSLTDLVRCIEGALGKRAILDRQPEQPGDVPVTYADTTRAKELLGFEAKVPVQEGIARFCRWYREERARGGVQ
jgi:UDP-glucuronate 4-epimerase